MPTAKHGRAAALALLAIVTAAYSSEHLLPAFEAIVASDESRYISSGTELVDRGRSEPLAYAPLLGVLYGVIYLFLHDSPHWFVHAAATGHLIIFCVFWLGLYRCVRALTPGIDPIFAMTLACAWLVAARFFERWNSSDYLFMAMAALALSQLPAYRSGRAAGHLAWGSAFAGLSALVRNDGLILCLSFLLLSAWLVRGGGRTSPWTAQGKHFAAASVPLALIVGGYVASFGASTMHRTYTAFEYGQLVTFQERYPQSSHAAARASALEDVRAQFGTRTENKSSVFRAIAGNPGAFLERVARSLQRLPRLVYAAHGRPLSVIFLLLAARGVVVLLRGRQWWLLAAPFVWHAHLAAYWLTFWHVRYVRFPFVWLVLLAAFGLREVAANFETPREKAFVAAMLAAATVCAAVDATTPSLLVPAIPSAGAAAWLLSRRYGASSGNRAIPSLRFELVLALGLLVTAAGAGGQAPSLPPPAAAGSSPPERALLAIADVLPPAAVIASESDRFPAAARARLVYLYLMVEEGVPHTRKAVEDWLDERRADAVYLDRIAMGGPYEQVFRRMLEHSAADGRYIVGFKDPPSDTYVLVRATLTQRAPGRPRP